MAVPDLILSQREIWQADTAYLARRSPGYFLRNAVASLSDAVVVDGHDHSHYQNEAHEDQHIPYHLLPPAGLEFAILKTTEGVQIVDPFWTQNWQAAVEAGLYVSGYHFFRSNRGGSQQGEFSLNNFLPLVQAVDYQPILFIDVESTDGTDNRTRSNRFNAMVHYLLNAGVQVGVYSSPGFWNGNMDHGVVSSTLPLIWQWVAHWTSAPIPYSPTGWTSERMKFWQQGISGAHSWVPEPPVGFSGNVDYNVFMGTLAELEQVLRVPSQPGCDCEEINARLDALEAALADIQASQAQHEARLNALEGWRDSTQALLDGIRDAWTGGG